MKLKLFSIFFSLIMVFGVAACDNNVALDPDDSDDPEFSESAPTGGDVITLQEWDNGDLGVVIAVTAFGGTGFDDLENMYINIYVNDLIFITGLNPQSFYYDSSDEVRFTLETIGLADELRFEIFINDATKKIYTGTPSDDGDSEANYQETVQVTF